MISSNQAVRAAHNRILYNAYKEAYCVGELIIHDGFIVAYNDEALHINDMKFVLERLDVDDWVVNSEFDNIIIMNAYRLPVDYTIVNYPCIIRFHGELDGGRMVFTHEVINV